MKPMDAVYFSVVYPGVGQFYQKRWGVGLFYGVVSTALLTHFALVFLRTIRAYYAFAFDFNAATPPHPSWVALAIDFVILTLVYILNIIDAWRIARRQKLEPPPMPPSSFGATK